MKGSRLAYGRATRGVAAKANSQTSPRFYFMSQAKHYDAVLVEKMLADTLAWWNEARHEEINAEKSLSDLARECANGTFQNHVVAIPIPRREIVARKFMEACAATFVYEVPKAAAEKVESIH